MGPILVTGVPRSGTTWLARLLAKAPGTALAGREPMNPRGRQYALGGTLQGWTRAGDFTQRQRFLLRSAYRGWNPMVYSRFGARQWAAALPGTRLVVKDPYALLSMPAVARVTGAVPVLVYRHPGAILASYRRVKWQPRLDELARIVDALTGNEPGSGHGLVLPEIPPAGAASPEEEMGIFWSVLHEFALADAATCGAVVVSHAELASGGVEAGRVLAAHLGLEWAPAMAMELSKESRGEVATSTQLHQFNRAPVAVAEEWRTKLGDEEMQRIEHVAAATFAKVEGARLRLLR
jgi:hypothetical protein